ncbi:uncharacterized protein [Euwallacea fornicatus]|uniref:uncharacterized protein isoform X2 n=1 Tax=Euwallacea fornicatus TaxID=995702 RepID=UPI00338E6733
MQVSARAMDPVQSHEGEENTVDVLQLIFSACDTQNAGFVHVSKLVEYIQPYLPENLRALDDLKNSLDPECKDVFVTNEQFVKVMGGWCHKLTTQSSEAGFEMDNIPNASVLLSDDKHSPVKHSTPRASLRDELLKCKDLLNISNISGYSLSSSQLEHSVGQDSTVLEEEIKNLKHQVSKLSSELVSVKYQLSVSEDQNEQLQQDLEKLNRQLHAEQLVNEHLHKDIKQSEELQEEFNNIKKEFIEMKQNLRQSEKNSLYYRKLVAEIENEKLKLEKEVGVYSKQNQDYLKEVFEVKIECEAKEQELNELTKKLKGLKSKMSDLQDVVDQLASENELLKYQKLTLRSALNTKSKPSSSSETNLASEPRREGEEVNTGNINQSLSEAFNWRSDEDLNLHPLQEEIFEADMKHLAEATAQEMTLEEQMKQLQVEKIEAESVLVAVMERINKILEQQGEVAQDPENAHSESQNLEVMGPKFETSNMFRTIRDGENVAEMIHFHLSSRNAVIQELKEVNVILRVKLTKAESDLGDKIGTVLRFKNELSYCIGVNDNLWRNIKTLRRDLHNKLIKLNKLIQCNNELNVHYSNLLLVHDDEFDKNGILCKFLEICKQKREEIFETCTALREQVNENPGEIKEYENDIERLKATIEVHTLTNQDSISKTNETALKMDAEFIKKIKVESNRIFKELNCKLDDEIIKNKELTQDLKELREKYLEVDSELLQIKHTLADCETETNMKLQESGEKADSSSVEALKTVHIVKEKDLLLKKIEEESQNRFLMAKDFEEKLSEELQKNKILTQDLEESNQSYKKLIGEMRTLREDLEKKKTELIWMENEFKSRLDAENEQNSVLSNKLDEITQKYSTLIESSSHVQEENAKLSLKVEETNQEIQRLRKKLDDRKTECASLLDQLPLIQASKFQLEEQKRALTEIVERLTGQNDELVLQVALLKVEKDALNCEISRLQLSCSKNALENDNLKTELSKVKASMCSNQENTKKSSFSKQQIMLDKLRNKIEDLEEKLKRVTAEKSQLVIQNNREQSSRCEANFKLSPLMKNVSTSTDQSSLELETKKFVEIAVPVTINVDVGLRCESETVALANVTDCQDSALDAELLDLVKLNQNLSTKQRFALNNETVLEVPTLDVSNFADCIEELGLNRSETGESNGNESEKEKLERITTALMLWFSNNSSTVPRSIDNQIEKYRNQYEALLYLLSDMSCRLRNHVCIGTPEPTFPVYELLEEVKLELKAVVQCASQISALICEDRMKRCCKLLINYCTILSQENERLRNKSRPFISCIMGAAGILAIALAAFGISLAVNFACRMMTEDDKYCPFDSGVKRINIGEPPM